MLQSWTKKDAHIIFSKVPAKKDKANTLGSKMLLRRNQHFIFQKTLKFMQLHLDGVNRYVLETWHQEEFSNDPTRRLFLDRAGAHYTDHFVTSMKDSQKENTIYIPAGCTDELQPLDVSVNSAKQHYSKIRRSRIIDNIWILIQCHRYNQKHNRNANMLLMQFRMPGKKFHFM